MMKYRGLAIIACTALLTACMDDDDNTTETPTPPPSFSASTTIEIDLTGKQQVPANMSAQMASATVELDETLGLMRASVDVSNVEGVQAIHIHDGDIGRNGEVAFEFTEGSTAGTYTLDETSVSSELITDLLEGEWYINVHTDTFEDGELRGQIVTDDMAVVTFMLDGNQEVPAVTTLADGYGYALVSTATYDLDLVIYTEDVGATAAHIHTGRVGNNGDVLVALEQSMEDTSMWMTPEDTMINEEIFAVLASGGHYVNVHSDAFPNGEIRGQILTDNFALATFALSGKQEVPVVDTAAYGSGYALVDTSSYALELTVVTEGVDDATAAHIHTGRVGMNGDVLVALEQSADDMGKWVTPDDLAIDAATFEVLASGGHYVNVHTPANGSGELRGQILTSNFALATFGLSGEQQVPVASTSAMGNGYALVNTSTFDLELVIDTTGVDNATGAHIPTGNIGTNGDVLVALEQSTSDPGMWMTPADTAINADILAVLAGGGHYVNVHTPAFPDGEIRGQIVTPQYVIATFGLSGAQEVPAVTTMASGNGYALVNSLTYDLDLVVHTDGVDDATAAHIHTGRVGMNGDVLVALEQSADDAGMWMTADDTMLTPAIFEVLASGGHYVNVHTPANPDGELRGQILTDNFVMVAFGLSGDQETHAVTTTATGSGYALVNTDDYSLELQVIISGVADATAAHIHTGAAGIDGPVLLGLEQDSDDMNRWMTPASAMLDATIFGVLAAGGHYVN
ncbi:MAG: CHRD domain-containing protein, partial [Pseudomonadota bacterium]|nr:CHRD domain-containing protein [Pseudomonadota bacterium]